MTTSDLTASDYTAARVRALRRRRALTIDDLAARCAKLGAPGLTRHVLYKIEASRDVPSRTPRPVTVDELLILAAALNCPPVSLLIPPDDHTEPYPVTPDLSAERGQVRAWVRGVVPLTDDDDPREFYAELPADEFYSVHGAVSVTTSPPRPRVSRPRKPSKAKEEPR
jgi:transcriptional regulator with XRE-family HTH domain